MLRHISTYLDLTAIFRTANMQNCSDEASDLTECSTMSQLENEETDEVITEEVS